MAHLNLCIPDWQGYAVSNDVFHGANELKGQLAKARVFHEIDVPASERLELANNILGYEANLRQLKTAATTIQNEKPDSIFLVGGTCASEIAPVSWLNQQYGGNLTLLWFDAHGDLNTPESSHSKHLHGMPLRTLLGDGDEEMLALSFSQLRPQQVVLIGTRDLDDEEQRYIDQHELSVVAPGSLSTLIDVVKTKASPNIYVHIDLDALDPTSYPHQLLPVPDGLTKSDLLNELKKLRTAFNVVGFSIVEFVPKGPDGHKLLEEIVDLLAAVDG